MKKLKKLKLQSAVLLDNPQMMAVCGGYCEFDGGTLPEVGIVCDRGPGGRCWALLGKQCVFTGIQSDLC